MVRSALTHDLVYRPYEAGDETAIGALFESSFGRTLPQPFWEWRYQANPAGGPWIELAWDGARLAAHYAVSSARVCIEGNEVGAALSMTTMTHPDYRGQGLFPLLGQRLYARLREHDVTVVYGFPNVNSHRGFVRDLGWRDLHEIPTLRVALAMARFSRSAASAVRIVDVVDDRCDALWARIAQTFPVWQRRDAAWLHWRFRTCPVQQYTLAAWHDGRHVRGWAVVKQFGSDGFDLVDFVAEDDAVARDLAHWALTVAEAAGASTVSTWCPLDAPWRGTLEACGFHPDAPVTYLGARSLLAKAAAAERPGNWGFSMADSDVY